MVKLRLIRIGRRNDPHFRIVAQDSRGVLKGRYLELLGHWSPVQKKGDISKERVLHWLSKGAKPSRTFWNMLVRQGAVKGKKVSVHAKRKEKEEQSGKTTSAEQGIDS